MKKILGILSLRLRLRGNLYPERRLLDSYNLENLLRGRLFWNHKHRCGCHHNGRYRPFDRIRDLFGWLWFALVANRTGSYASRGSGRDHCLFPCGWIDSRNSHYQGQIAAFCCNLMRPAALPRHNAWFYGRSISGLRDRLQGTSNLQPET